MDHNNIEFEFVLYTSCKIVSQFDPETNEDLKLIHLINPSSLIAYQTWSGDTLFLNNKERRTFTLSLDYFFAVVEKFNEKREGDNKYKPTIVVRQKETGVPVFANVEKFITLTDSVSMGSASNDDCGCLTSGITSNTYALLCDNNFTNISFSKDGARVPEMNNTGDMPIEVTINFSPLPYSDIDFYESRDYTPFKSNAIFYETIKDKVSNNHSCASARSLYQTLISKRAPSKPLPPKRSFNFIINDNATIEMRGTRRCIVIKDPKMIMAYQVWNKGGRGYNMNRRALDYITAGELAAGVSQINDYMKMNIDKSSSVFAFTPSCYVEVTYPDPALNEDNKYIVIVDAISYNLNTFNSSSKKYTTDVVPELVLVLNTYDMCDPSGASLPLPLVTDKPVPVYINMDPTPTNSSINNSDMKSVLQGIGLHYVSILAAAGRVDPYILLAFPRPKVDSNPKGLKAIKPKKAIKTTPVSSKNETVLQAKGGVKKISKSLMHKLRGSGNDFKFGIKNKTVPLKVQIKEGEEDEPEDTPLPIDDDYYILDPNFSKETEDPTYEVKVAGFNDEDAPLDEDTNPPVFYLKPAWRTEWERTPNIRLFMGVTYKFDVSDPSFLSVPGPFTFDFSTNDNGTNAPGGKLWTGPGVSGSSKRAGTEGAFIKISPTMQTPHPLYYFERGTNNMGGEIHIQLPWTLYNNGPAPKKPDQPDTPNDPDNPNNPDDKPEPDGPLDLLALIALAALGGAVTSLLGKWVYDKLRKRGGQINLDPADPSPGLVPDPPGATAGVVQEPISEANRVHNSAVNNAIYDKTENPLYKAEDSKGQFYSSIVEEVYASASMGEESLPNQLYNAVEVTNTLSASDTAQLINTFIEQGRVVEGTSVNSLEAVYQDVKEDYQQVLSSKMVDNNKPFVATDDAFGNPIDPSFEGQSIKVYTENGIEFVTVKDKLQSEDGYTVLQGDSPTLGNLLATNSTDLPPNSSVNASNNNDPGANYNRLNRVQDIPGPTASAAAAESLGLGRGYTYSDVTYSHLLGADLDKLEREAVNGFLDSAAEKSCTDGYSEVLGSTPGEDDYSEALPPPGANTEGDYSEALPPPGANTEGDYSEALPAPGANTEDNSKINKSMNIRLKDEACTEEDRAVQEAVEEVKKDLESNPKFEDGTFTYEDLQTLIKSKLQEKGVSVGRIDLIDLGIEREYFVSFEVNNLKQTVEDIENNTGIFKDLEQLQDVSIFDDSATTLSSMLENLDGLNITQSTDGSLQYTNKFERPQTLTKTDLENSISRATQESIGGLDSNQIITRLQSENLAVTEANVKEVTRKIINEKFSGNLKSVLENDYNMDFSGLSPDIDISVIFDTIGSEAMSTTIIATECKSVVNSINNAAKNMINDFKAETVGDILASNPIQDAITEAGEGGLESIINSIKQGVSDAVSSTPLSKTYMSDLTNAAKSKIGYNLEEMGISAETAAEVAGKFGEAAESELSLLDLFEL